MQPEGAFRGALAEVLGRELPPRSRVRQWRRTLAKLDQVTFDRAIDRPNQVSTADLHRAIVAAGYDSVTYGQVHAYRRSVLEEGAER